MEKIMSKLTEIRGIDEDAQNKLKNVGIASIEEFIEQCGDKKGRKEIAGQTGIDEKQILQWLNRADLSRIKGVSTLYADLLEFAGVDTVPELAQRKAENLQAKMAVVNEEKQLVQRVPPLALVEDWVSQAKELPRVINY